MLVHGGVGRGRMGGGVSWVAGRLATLGGKEVASSVSEGETGRGVGRGELVLCKTGRRKPPIVRFGY